MDDLLKIIRGNFDNLTKEFNINPNKLYKNFDDYFASATIKIPENFSTEYNARAVDIYNQLKNEAQISSDDYTAQRRKKINKQNRRRNNRRKEFTMEDGSTVKQYFDKNKNIRAQVKIVPDGTREVRRQHTAKTISEDPLAKNMSKVVSKYDGHTTDIHRRPDAMHVERRIINHDTGDIVTTHQTRANKWGGGVSSENIDVSTIEEERLLHNQRMDQRYGGANNTQQNIDRSINKNNTSSGSSAYDNMKNVVKNDSRIEFYEKNGIVGFSDFGDEFENYVFEGAFDTDGNIKYFDVAHRLGETSSTYDFMDPKQRQKFFDIYANNHGETAEISQSLNKFSQFLDEQQNVKTERYVDRQQANVERQRERARQDLERQEQKQREKEQARQERDRQEKEWQEQRRQQYEQQQTQQQRTINMDDPSSWTDDDIREMAQGDPEHAQELINQRNAARGQNQQQTNQQQRTINVDDPGSWTDDDIREMAQGDPEHAQELINQRDAARSQNQSQQQANQNAPDTDQVVNNVEQTQQTTNQRTQSDWRQKIKDEERARRGVNRIDIDEATAQVKVDTSDPYNIYKTTTDAQGNTRTQHWNRKNANGGDATLVSDVTFNADATYNNITGEYSGPDRSHIDWINADEWDDDYILNRAGDNEELMNSMMNARERKIQANEKYRQEHPDMNNPDDINASNNVDTPSPDNPIPETTHNVDTRPQVDPNNPLTWTENYMDEISEGDPTYYEQLSRQRDAAIKADKYKNIDPSNPSSWTDDYIKDTALNEDEFNWMNQKMRNAKNLDTVDKINKQRQNQRQPNRQERRQQQREGRQKGNQQKPLTKKERERQRRQREFEARQRAMGNDPDEVRKNNRRYNEEQKKKKKQQQQQNPNQQNKKKRGPKLFDENDPTTWTKKDIKDMADGDPERFKDLMKRFKEAKKGNIIGDYNHVPDVEDFDFHDAPIPDMPSSEMPDTEWIDDLVNNADDIAEEAVESGAKGLGKLGTMDKIMSGVNVLGAIGDYKTARRKGHGVVSSAVRAGAQFAIYEALGLWALPVTLLQHTPGAIIKGADMLYKENRRMNSAANNQIFGNAEFLDTQQLATMRQSGMEMAKMAQYNLQQTLMGNEATYLHR